MALNPRPNPTPRPPPDCPVLGCIELVRGAWAPNVIWFLEGGPRRFGELRRDLAPVSAKVLAARLRAMQAHGVVSRRALDTSPPSVEYALTATGAELVPVVHLLLDVGLKLKRQRANSATQFASHDRPPSSEKDWTNRNDFGVMSEKTKRTKIARPR
jgi:DNA-binding HxlR family transcriptional regulator